MYQRFDDAIANALTSEHSQYGAGERRLAMTTARRSAAENRVKALNEATLGKVAFAQMHETASARFHQDAEAMSQGRAPVNHPVSYYLSTAAAYRKADASRRESAAMDGHEASAAA